MLFHLAAAAQCISGDRLWNSIAGLQKAGIEENEQLKALNKLLLQADQCTDGRDSSYAFLLQRIGVMYYLKTDYHSAVKYSILSLAVLNEDRNQNRVNPKQKFRVFRNLNIYYDSLKDWKRKNETADSAIAIGLAAGINDSMFLYTISDRITDLLDAGDYTRCIEYASYAENHARKYGFTQTDIINIIFSWKVNALILSDQDEAAAGELQKKIKIFESVHAFSQLGTFYGLLAEIYKKNNKTDSALYCLNRSFQIYQQSAFNDGCAADLDHMGLLYFENRHDFPRALEYFRKALHYPSSREPLSIYTNMGNVYAKERAFDTAFYYFRKAFDQIRPGTDETTLLGNQHHELLLNYSDYIVNLILSKSETSLNRYRASQQPDQLKQTLALYRLDDRIMDKINQHQTEIQSKLIWRKNIRRLYEHAVEACRLDNNAEQGLYFFEKSRAVLLDDQLKADRLMQRTELNGQFELKKKINALDNKLDTMAPGSGEYASTQAEWISNKEKLDDLLQNIRTRDPLFYARHPTEDSFRISDIREKILQDHSAILELLNGDSALYVLCISKTESRITVVLKKSFDSLSRLFFQLISSPDQLNRNFNLFTEVSRDLQNLLFKGIAIPAGRLIISPDGIPIPFEALVTHRGTEIKYMLDDYAVSYTYSARFLMTPFPQGSGPWISDFMGVAPVNYASYMNLVDLPGSDESLERIQKIFSNPYTAVRQQASRMNFLENFSGYKMLQLYSHASYDGEPLLFFSDSAMVLSDLLVDEIPATRLVVLSACKTALGNDYKGEGIFSFGREFASLGIPATISNLWSVDNASTYRITELFYQFISQGLPTDQALREAKLRFIRESTREKSLPFYWASSILTGQSEILKTASGFPYRMAFLLILLAAIGTGLYLRFKF